MNKAGATRAHERRDEGIGPVAEGLGGLMHPRPLPGRDAGIVLERARNRGRVHAGEAGEFGEGLAGLQVAGADVRADWDGEGFDEAEAEALQEQRRKDPDACDDGNRAEEVKHRVDAIGKRRGPLGEHLEVEKVVELVQIHSA